MKNLFFALPAMCLLAGGVQAQSMPAAAPSVPATDTYFGTTVNDPYRNLENLNDPAVEQTKRI